MSLVRNLATVAALSTATLFSASALADEVNVAVAANFTDAAKEIGQAYKAKTNNDVVFSFGASGALYTQISQGAPFQVFLSADAARPKKAIDEGFGVAGSNFTYAIGKLVLWSKKPGVVTGEDTLKNASVNKVAICDPKAAPYGQAAVETMQSLKVYDTLQPKLVQGANITQAFQFVDTGNAEIGFVALSQVIGKTEGSQWMVPQDLYKPIKQDAVLLSKGSDSKAAKDFIDFLKSPDAVAIIKKYGYETAN
jgi:molybdate transport system substrate-binding protein